VGSAGGIADGRPVCSGGGACGGGAGGVFCAGAAWLGCAVFAALCCSGFLEQAVVAIASITRLESQM
jgi:hypothetical protein